MTVVNFSFTAFKITWSRVISSSSYKGRSASIIS